LIHIEINDVPPSPNVLRRDYRTPHAYKRLRESWEWMILAAPCATHRAQLKAASRKVRMEVQITIYHKKSYDPDNLPGTQKVILDAMQNIGFLANDNEAKLLLHPCVQVVGKEVKTVIKIGPASAAQETQPKA
jgi:Holliday junction resolvase RusA-like endonuclease